MKKTYYTISIILLIANTLFGATYYISTVSGNDLRTAAQAQIQLTPWQTLLNLSSLILAPGDQVLLERGNTFFGGITVNQSGTAAAPVTYGAYGLGERPIVSGVVAISGFSLESGRYVATYTGAASRPIEQLFAGKTPLRCARFPNSGYIAIDSALSTTEFFCTALIGLTDWTGAAIHIRSERWSLDARTITVFDKTTGRIILDRAANYEINKGEGVFINNALAALDNGEWFYDSLTKKVYLATTTTPPSISASVEPYGLNCSGKSYITIDNITFFGHTTASIQISGASNIALTNCDALYCDGYGMSLSMNDSRIDGCTIEWSNEGGVICWYGLRNVISYSTIKHIGMINRLNRKGLGGGCCTARALSFGGNNNTISDNSIDSIGYVGIGFGGQNNLIQRNTVEHICMTIDDGAAIYTWSPSFDSAGSQGTIIRKNIVGNAVGAPEGTGSTDNNSCQGIYMDDRTHHVRIDSNTVFNNYLGIFLHNNRYHIVTGNICYGNRGNQIQISRDAIVSAEVYGNQVFGNIFYATSESQGTIVETRYAQQDSALATISNNYTVVESPFAATCQKDGTLIWKMNFVNDSVVGTNKIPTGEFDQSPTGWNSWPAQFFELTRDTVASPDKRCLKIRYFGDGTEGPIFFAAPSYPLDSGHLYRLRFSAKENHAGQIIAVARISSTPYTTAGLSRTILLDTGWNDYELFFESNLTNQTCRVDFYPSNTDTIIYIDNVSLYEIDSKINSELRSRLFYNTSTTARNFSLGSYSWRDVYGATGLTGTISLPPFLSQILITDSQSTAGVLSEKASKPQIAGPIRIISIRQGHITLAVNSHLYPLRITLTNLYGREIASRTIAAGGSSMHIIKPEQGQFGSGIVLIKATDGWVTSSRKIVFMKH